MSPVITTHPETYLKGVKSKDLSLINPDIIYRTAMPNTSCTLTSIHIATTAQGPAEITKADHPALRKLQKKENTKS